MKQGLYRSIALSTVALVLLTAAFATAGQAAENYLTVPGTSVYFDNFKSLAMEWGVSDQALFVKDGALQMMANPHSSHRRFNSNLHYRRITKTAVINTFVILVETKSLGGLLFWGDGSAEYYLFLINGDGQFSVFRHRVGKFEAVIGWRKSSAVKTGKGTPNRLEVVDRGDKAYFTINGSPVGDAAAPVTVPGDRVGFLCESTGDSQANCRFTRLAVAVAPPPTGTVVYSDDFHSMGSGWGSPNKTGFVKDGVMEFSSDPERAHTRFNTEVRERSFSPRALIRAELTLPSPVGKNHSGGPMFWVKDNDEYYNFLIDGAGRFAVFRRKDGKFISLVNWTNASAIETADGALNRLEIVDEGFNAYLLINGLMVTHLSVPQIGSADKIGLYCQSVDKAGATCRFSRFEISEIPLTPGVTVYSDYFRSMAPGWGKPDRTFSVHPGISNGQLVILADPNATTQRLNTDLHYRQHVNAADISLDVARSGTNTEAGLVFWAKDEEDEYVVRTHLGRFAVQHRLRANSTNIIPWSDSPYLRSSDGATNQLRVIDEGSKARILINGHVVGQVTAPLSGAGDRLGLFCYSDGALAAKCAFSKLSVTVPIPQKPVQQRINPLLYSDDFNEMAVGWGRPDGNVSVTSGQLVMLVSPHQTLQRYKSDLHYRQKTKRASIRLTMHRYGDNTEAGLAFWGEDDKNQFIFRTHLGRFAVQRWTNGNFQSVMDWTGTPYLHAADGATNELEVIDQGDKAYFLANGYVVGQAAAPLQIAGDLIGLFCNSDGNAAAKCGFSKLSVTIASDESPALPPPPPLVYSQDVKPDRVFP